MTTNAENTEGANLFGDEHVRRYRETDGEVGHIWKRGSRILLLTTEGRDSGEPYTTPLIYGRDGDDYVIVASKGGAPDHPDWYKNLRANPDVRIQVKDEVMEARAETVTGDRRERLWELMNGEWADYDHYQEKTDREIPVVALTPKG
ncbi:MAG: nitroreductase family deazaflavin-dependent oxidoreductase [Nitriliruptorales bacterium]|nr:nitroreductase family deazaflavin-dependent oxidoreductase [Nitriliruptorales bacterium]